MDKNKSTLTSPDARINLCNKHMQYFFSLFGEDELLDPDVRQISFVRRGNRWKFPTSPIEHGSVGSEIQGMARKT